MHVILRVMKAVRFVTFGCKANQYDTQVLREALARRGWAEQDADAELVVVNTCTVTAEAGRKARKLIRRLGREDPDVRIAVTGCLAESEPELLRELPCVDWVLGNGEAKRPANFLRHLGEEVDPEELGIPSGITEFAGHTRAFLKIQDGCDEHCTYCVIPSVRGVSVSRPLTEVVQQARRMVEAAQVAGNLPLAQAFADRLLQSSSLRVQGGVRRFPTPRRPMRRLGRRTGALRSASPVVRGRSPLQRPEVNRGDRGRSWSGHAGRRAVRRSVGANGQFWIPV